MCLGSIGCSQSALPLHIYRGKVWTLLQVKILEDPAQIASFLSDSHISNCLVNPIGLSGGGGLFGPSHLTVWWAAGNMPAQFGAQHMPSCFFVKNMNQKHLD